MSYTNIPEELQALSQWVTWREEVRTDSNGNEKKTKVPYQANIKGLIHADTTNPATWTDFITATSRVEFERDVSGIGFVFTRDDPYIGFDIDDDDRDRMGSLLEMLGSYADISPSGSGYHVIGRGKLPVDNSGRHPRGLGIFQHSRFFTMTGNLVDGEIRPIVDVQPFIDANWESWFPVSEIPVSAPSEWTGDDASIVDKLLSERNSSKFEGLWAGDTSTYGDDDSAADLALCSKISFYTQDASQIARIFSQSGLMRPKWNRPDYRERTITKALNRSETYDPSRSDTDADRFVSTANGTVLGTQQTSTDALHKTDIGNAERLASRHSGSIHYSHQWDQWLIWDGTRFKRDDSGEIFRRAKETVRSMYGEAEAEENSGARKALAGHALKSESSQRIKAMIDLARHESSVAVSPEILDADQFLLNIGNGTVNLHTGELQPHNPSDLITRIANVTYDENAECPLWMEFLNHILRDDQELIEFLGRAVGYSMTGDTSEQVMFILHGNGQTGKGTFLDTIGYILQDYKGSLPVERIMIRHGDAGILNDLAKLVGVRFVRSTETTDGKRMDEAIVKTMTGGDPMPVRFMHKEFFDMVPNFKLWMSTNYKPVIRGMDNGIWRRMRLLPFTVVIPDEEKDGGLREKLKLEAPGILNWMIQGCLRWQKVGLTPPSIVAEATAEYRQEMDVFGSFLSDCCILEPQSPDDILAESSDRLYLFYKTWAQDNGEYQMTKTAFGRKLNELGLEKKQHANGIRGRSYSGIKLRSEITSPTPVGLFPATNGIKIFNS